jgi:hypothetical protein
VLERVQSFVGLLQRETLDLRANRYLGSKVQEIAAVFPSIIGDTIRKV